MGFVEEYKISLQKCFDANDILLAGELIKGFHKLDNVPDEECLYYEAVFYYYSLDYPMSLFYADMCYLRNPLYAPVWELLEMLTEYSGDWSKYQPTFKKDVSSYYRRLNIMIPRGFLPIVDYTVDVFKAKLGALGHIVNVIDVHNSYIGMDGGKPDINLLSETDLVCEFNNMGCHFIDGEGVDYFDKLGIPIFSYIFDHPLYYLDSFLNITPNYYIMCADRNHEKYIHRFYKGVKNCFFLPLGSEERSEEKILWKDRTIRCLYVGSLKQPKYGKEDKFSSLVFDFLLSNSHFTTEDAIEKCYFELSQNEYEMIFPHLLEYYPQKPIDDSFVMKLITNYSFIDLKINSLFRKRLVEVLLEAGIEVEVYGAGWDAPEMLANECFRYGGLISQEDCLSKMLNSKFILNSMPWFKDGTHDRIYNAMLAGGICVTDPSKYLLEEFTDGEDIVYYDLNHMEKLPDIIRYYEAHPELIQPILDKAYSKTVLKHSWTNRIITMMEHFFD